MARGKVRKASGDVKMNVPVSTEGIAPELEEQVAALLGDIAHRLQAGERIDLAEWTQRYPQYAPQIAKFLPAMQMLAQLNDSASDASQGARSADASADPAENRLGDYRILREIGRGGMGIVYEAEQISLRRRVALKVLPYAAIMDPRQLARFQNEAHAAASLRHPHIVPVYSVGRERGVHYYAMQYVDGQSLAQVVQYLRSKEHLATIDQAAISEGDRGAVTLPFAPPNAPHDEPQEAPDASRRERVPPKPDVDAAPIVDTPPDVDTAPAAHLATDRSSNGQAYFRSVARLGIQAAEALDHAHRHGIVHRDVKPSNLMLDTNGELWVTDFGLARLENETNITMTGDVLGTLRYMSPEQLQGQRAVVDGRADIYSLGATLYELLALEPVWKGFNRGELTRHIASDEPRPLRYHNRRIPAELEIITLKALEKRPEDRYATAQEMADDLRRYLTDQPIRAKRANLFERIGKWSRRHRPLIHAAIAALVVIALGLASSTFLLFRKHDELVAERDRATQQQQRAEQAERDAKEQQTKAERSAAIAEAVNHFLTEDLLGQADPELNAVGDQVTLLEILDQAAEKVDTTFSEQPDIRASLHRTIARTYRGLGQYEKSARHFRDALDAMQKLDASPNRNKTELQIELAEILTELVQLDTAEPMLRDCLKLVREQWGLRDNLARQAIEALGAVASLREQDNMIAEVLTLMRQHVEAAKNSFGPEHAETLAALDSLGLALREAGESEEAEQVLRPVVAARSRVLGAEHVDTLESVNHLVVVLLDLTQPEEAEQLARANLDARRRVLGPAAKETLEDEANLSVALALQKEYEEAEQLVRHVVTEMQKSRGATHPETLGLTENLCWLLMLQNRLEEARELLQQNWEELRRTRGPEHIASIQAGDRLCLLLVDIGRFTDAEAVGRACVEAAHKALPDQHTTRQEAMAVLAFALYAQGRIADARTVISDDFLSMFSGKGNERNFAMVLAMQSADDGEMSLALECALDAVNIQRETAQAEPPISFASTLALYGRLLILEGQPAKAEPVLRECLTIRKTAMPEDHWLVAETESLLALSLAFRDRFSEAESLLTHAHPIIEASPELTPWQKADALERWVILYEKWNKSDERINWAHKLESSLRGLRNEAPPATPEETTSQLDLESRLGQCAAWNGRFDEAEPMLLNAFDQLTQLQAKTKRPVPSWLYRTEGEFAKRLAHCTALRGDTTQAQAWTKLAEHRSDTRSIRSATARVQCWESLAPQYPPTSWIQFSCVNSCMALADLLVAQSESEEELLQFAPQAVDVYGKAESVLLRILDADPENVQAKAKLRLVCVRRVGLFNTLSQFPQAFAEMDRALTREPDNQMFLRNKAWSLANCPDLGCRDVQQALTLASRAVELAPDSTVNWGTLGRVQFRAGQWAEAIQSLSRSVKPGDSGGSTVDKLVLAMACWQAGDKDAARQWYNSAAKQIAKMTRKPAVHQRAGFLEMSRLLDEACDLLGTPPVPLPTESAKTFPPVEKDVDSWWSRAGSFLRKTVESNEAE